MPRSIIKREVDFQIISSWIQPNSKVLDLGCGRGILLEHLSKNKAVYTVGVDNNPKKILDCVKREVSAYQGDMLAILKQYPDAFFDWIICSRTLHQLASPAEVIFESLRVAKHLAIAFINNGFWLNRLNILFQGNRIINDVFPLAWHESEPSNPLCINEFEKFCANKKITINRSVYLDGTWKRPCRFLPSLFAGYVIYDLSKEK
jgi:methionine biosynthesis protein MetW